MQPTVIATELVLRDNTTVRLAYVPGGDDSLHFVLDADSSDAKDADLSEAEARAICDFIQHWLARPRVSAIRPFVP